MEKWEEILARTRAGARLMAEDALVLWHDAPLWRLAEVAVEKKRSISADKVFYNKNFNHNITLFSGYVIIIYKKIS